MYRLLVFNFFSIVASEATRLSLSWETLRLAGTDGVATLTMCYTVPQAIGVLGAGLLVDRFGAKRLLLMDCLSRGVVSLVLFLVFLLPAPPIASVYALVALSATLSGIALTAVASLAISIAPSKLRLIGILEVLSFFLGTSVGQPSGSWLAPQIGTHSVILIDGITFLSFAGVVMTRRMTNESMTTTIQINFRRTLKAVLVEPTLLASLVFWLTYQFVFGALLVWAPEFSMLKTGDSGFYAGVQASLAFGMGMGMIASLAVVRSTHARKLLVALSVVGAGVLFLLTGCAANVTALGLFALYGLAGGVTAGVTSSARLRVINPGDIGQTLGLMRSAAWFAPGIGAAFAAEYYQTEHFFPLMAGVILLTAVPLVRARGIDLLADDPGKPHSIPPP